MAIETWGRSRHAIRITQYNEGCGLWLYDDSHREMLRTSGVPLLAVDDAGLSTSKLEAISEFTRQGIVRICELDQDDSLDIVVFPRGIPDALELAFGRWHPPFHGRVTLPSGRLAVEGANALRITTEYEPDEPTDVVEVEPGEYVVSLFNEDRLLARDELPERDGDDSRPWQALALTPADEFDGSLDERPFWPWVPPLPPPAWLGDYHVDETRFRGLYNAPDFWDTVQVNLDRVAAERMRLAEGEILSVVTDLGEIRVIYRGTAPDFRLGEKRPPVEFGGHDETGGAYLHPDPDAGETLWIYRWETADLCFQKRAAWRPVTIERWHG